MHVQVIKISQDGMDLGRVAIGSFHYEGRTALRAGADIEEMVKASATLNT